MLKLYLGETAVHHSCPRRCASVIPAKVDLHASVLLFSEHLKSV